MPCFLSVHPMKHEALCSIYLRLGAIYKACQPSLKENITTATPGIEKIISQPDISYAMLLSGSPFWVDKFLYIKEKIKAS